MPNLGILIITHYPRLLSYIRPEFVHVLLDGRIVESGGWELAELLEEKGYDPIREKYGIAEVEVETDAEASGLATL